PVQGKIINAARVDHLPNRRGLGFEQRSSRLYLYGLCHLTRFEREINYHGRAHVDRDIALGHGLEPLEGGADRVTPDSDRRELITTIRPGCGRELGVGAFVSERDVG